MTLFHSTRTGWVAALAAGVLDLPDVGHPVCRLMEEGLENLLSATGEALAGDHHLWCLGLTDLPLRVGVVAQGGSTPLAARRLDDQEHVGNVRVESLNRSPGVVQDPDGFVRDLDVGCVVHWFLLVG